MIQVKHENLLLSLTAFLFIIIVCCDLAFGLGPARSIECNGRLVKVGASTSEVSELCGEPSDVVERREFRSTEISQPLGDPVKGPPTITQRVTSEVLIEEWSYDFGPNRFIRRLTFENGHLLNILVSDYGVH